MRLREKPAWKLWRGTGRVFLFHYPPLQRDCARSWGGYFRNRFPPLHHQPEREPFSANSLGKRSSPPTGSMWPLLAHTPHSKAPETRQRLLGPGSNAGFDTAAYRELTVDTLRRTDQTHRLGHPKALVRQFDRGRPVVKPEACTTETEICISIRRPDLQQ